MNLHSSHQIQSSRFGDAKRPALRIRGLAVAGLLSGAWRDTRGASARGPSLHAPELSEAELTEITPLLCRSGAGALAWSQLRDTALANCPAAQELREVYRRQRLSALLHEREIAQVITLLRAAGIEPVLIKGWAIARRYPDCALRPYGDIDLCVRPDQYDQATRVLARIASIEGPFVDLHCGFAGVGQTKVQSPKSKVQSLSSLRGLWSLDFGLWSKDGDDWDELFERSQVVQCATNVLSEPGAVATGFFHSSMADSSGRTRSLPLPVLTIPVRVLGDEDHLRILCRHLLRSGAHRPPWLCDVALLLEDVQSPKSKVQSPVNQVQSPLDRVAVKDSSRGLRARRDTPGSDHTNSFDPEGVKEGFGRSSFDWNICLGRNTLDANWIGVAVGLAHELLGASIDKTPFANQKLPKWLAPAVLEHWGGKRSGRWAVGSGQTKVQSHDLVQSPTSSLTPSGSGAFMRSDPGVSRQARNPRLLSLTATRSPGVSTFAAGVSTFVAGLWTLDFGPWTNLYHRWDNPIRATAAVGGRFDERSRIPYRLLESAMRLREWPRARGQ